MRKNYIIPCAVKWGLIVLFSLYMTGITLFYHEHRIGNARIVHSHPFGDDDHHHSASDFFLIAQLNHFASTADIVPRFDLNTPIVVLDDLNGRAIDPFIPKLYFLTLSSRAPPASVA
ncbi:MAG: hypothetical protein ACOX19_07815 [Fermentimonas sp.]